MMSRKWRSVLAYLATMSLLLVSASIVLAYLLFTPSSGWQAGFALLLSLQALIVAAMAAAMFALGQVIFEVSPVVGVSIWLALLVLALAVLTALLAYVLLGFMLAIWLLQGALVLLSLPAPAMSKHGPLRAEAG